MLLCTPKILQFEHRTWKFVQLKFMGRTEWKCERTISTLNTEVVPVLSFTFIQMVSCESGGNQRLVRGVVDERQFPESQQAPITFLGATMNVSRSQSRSSDGPEFGNEKRAHVENIDAAKSTEKLEALETRCLLDISGDVIGF